LSNLAHFIPNWYKNQGFTFYEIKLLLEKLSFINKTRGDISLVQNEKDTKQNSPVASICVNEMGETILARVKFKSQETDPFDKGRSPSEFMLEHDYCGGEVKIVKVSQTHKAFVCDNCNGRWVIPATYCSTLALMEIYFSEHQTLTHIEK
jgi:hypothetical protein